MADVFISYKSWDRTRPEVLRRWFEAAGWTVWIDQATEVGELWEARIERELTEAKVVVVVWSPEARRSEWVLREATAALRDGRLVQVRATALPPPRRSTPSRRSGWRPGPGGRITPRRTG